MRSGNNADRLTTTAKKKDPFGSAFSSMTRTEGEHHAAHRAFFVSTATTNGAGVKILVAVATAVAAAAATTAVTTTTTTATTGSTAPATRTRRPLAGFIHRQRTTIDVVTVERVDRRLRRGDANGLRRDRTGPRRQSPGRGLAGLTARLRNYK